MMATPVRRTRQSSEWKTPGQPAGHYTRNDPWQKCWRIAPIASHTAAKAS
jgi:hypothetical protein